MCEISWLIDEENFVHWIILLQKPQYLDYFYYGQIFKRILFYTIYNAAFNSNILLHIIFGYISRFYFIFQTITFDWQTNNSLLCSVFLQLGSLPPVPRELYSDPARDVHLVHPGAGSLETDHDPPPHQCCHSLHSPEVLLHDHPGIRWVQAPGGRE